MVTDLQHEVNDETVVIAVGCPGVLADGCKLLWMYVQHEAVNGPLQTVVSGHKEAVLYHGSSSSNSSSWGVWFVQM